MKDKKRILVTGSAGFIGMHLCKDLLKEGFQVYGIDNLNDYYDPELKEARLNSLLKYKNFKFSKIDITDIKSLKKIFKSFIPDKVVNLAAQAGVRYSLENPQAYINSNITGFMNILECSRHNNVKGLIYASSSSVYGGNEKIPFSIKDSVDKPISIYAATKKSNELMAHTYSHLYGLNSTGLRFFTVYGPWGRPDMAMYIFAKNILAGIDIPVFNNGLMQRDFTYIDDVVAGIRSAIVHNYKYEIFNIGNSISENLMDVISLIEDLLSMKAKIKFMGMQPGDVKKTFSDINYSINKLGYEPKTSIENGLPKFISWFLEYQKNDT